MVAPDERTDEPLMLSTHELRQRGWTPSLIRDFLTHHDATRPNLMRLGSRRRLPPVKLYLKERVDEAESTEEFLVAQGRAMDARDRAERAKLTRQANRMARADAFVDAWNPSIVPTAIRRGAHRKAFEAHEDLLRRAQVQVRAHVTDLTRAEAASVDERLRDRYLAALRSAYPWLQDVATQPRRASHR